MDAAILTVGDELLVGNVENANATWLATRLADRGVDVREIRVVPDEPTAIAPAVRAFAERVDATIVTSGLGSTPDDVTLEGVATAFDLSLEPDASARSEIEATVAAIREEYPAFDFDLETAAHYPARGRPIPNDEGIVPGWVIEPVYVLPGMPAEMKSTFDAIADAFAGDRRSRTVYSTEPESHLTDLLKTVHERFDVAVGCYPGGKHKRLTLSATDADRLERAVAWLTDQPEIDESRHQAPRSRSSGVCRVTVVDRGRIRRSRGWAGVIRLGSHESPSVLQNATGHPTDRWTGVPATRARLRAFRPPAARHQLPVAFRLATKHARDRFDAILGASLVALVVVDLKRGDDTIALGGFVGHLNGLEHLVD